MRSEHGFQRIGIDLLEAFPHFYESEYINYFRCVNFYYLVIEYDCHKTEAVELWVNVRFVRKS